MLQDFRYGFRLLLKSPGFTIVAVLTLALGIGATTAVFSVANAALLRPLPYPDPESLVLLWGNTIRNGVTERRGASYPDFVDWRQQSQSFDSMAAVSNTAMTLDDENPERLTGELVSASYFDVLGVRSSTGRTFAPQEDSTPDTHTVAVLSNGLWTRRFGSDPNIIGKQLRLDTNVYTVIGVMPAGFRGLTDSAEFWLPMADLSADTLTARGSRWLQVVARRKAGVTTSGAQADLDTICRRLAQAYPKTNDQRGVEVIGLGQDLFSSVRKPLLVALAAVLMVLLISCLNLSNLLLAQAEGRHREIAIRQALGATGARTMRQLLTESALLAALGAGLGLGLASWLRDGLLALSPITLPSFVQVGLDRSVLAFIVAVTIATALLVGALPAITLSRRSLNEALKDTSSRAGQSQGRQRVRAVLVVTEVALALVLLYGAGLLMSSFERLLAFNPGFDPRGVLTFRVDLSRGEQSDTKVANKALALIDQLRSLPGVTAVSVSSDLPLDGNSSAIFYTPEGNNVAAEQKRPRAYVHRVSPEFFSTLRIPILAGRPFTAAEMTSTTQRVIISQDVARRYWPGENPIGKRLKAGGPDSQQPWFEVIGVAGDTNYRAIPRNPTPDPDLYYPLSERSRVFSVALRSQSDSTMLTAAVRDQIKGFAPGAPLYGTATMAQNVSGQLETSKFISLLIGSFGGVALCLALIGIYGVTSFLVTRRTQEIGVRIALGAQPMQIFAAVVGRGFLLAAIGVGVGGAAAFAFGRVLNTLLFGVSALNLFVTVAVILLVLVCAGLASFLPARRATKVDPMVALRYE